MCNIYRGIQNTTYYVQHLSRNSKYNLLCVNIYRGIYKIQPIMCNDLSWHYKIQHYYMGNIYR